MIVNVPQQRYCVSARIAVSKQSAKHAKNSSKILSYAIYMWA